MTHIPKETKVAAMLDDVHYRFLVSFFYYIIKHGRHVFVILFPKG
jgi:hypothetical protein